LTVLPADWFAGFFTACANAGPATLHRVSTATQQITAWTKFTSTSLFSAVFISQGHRLPFRIVQVVQEAWAVSMKKSFGCGSKF
jgi:hypothetical protein